MSVTNINDYKLRRAMIGNRKVEEEPDFKEQSVERLIASVNRINAMLKDFKELERMGKEFQRERAKSKS